MDIKVDIYNNKERWTNWKAENKNRIKYLSKENSDVLLEFLNDMENGENVTPRYKGARNPTTLINLRDHISFFMKHFKKPILSITKKELHELDRKVREGVIKKNNGKPFSAFGNYIKTFKAFWSWVIRTKKATEDIARDLTKKNDKKPAWVYLNEEQFKEMANRANSDYRALIWFMYDTGMRVTEAYSIKIKHFDKDFTELTIPQEVAKTFGRVITLKICPSLIKEYIKFHKLTPDDFFITKKAPAFNKYLREHCEKLFGKGETKARGHYNEFSIYSIRHNASCYWLKRYPNLRGLKYRMGWKREEQATYYHEFMGLSDEISDDDMVTGEDKTKLQKMELEMERFKNQARELETLKKNQLVLMTDLERRKQFDPILNKLVQRPEVVKLLKAKAI